MATATINTKSGRAGDLAPSRQGIGTAAHESRPAFDPRLLQQIIASPPGEARDRALVMELRRQAALYGASQSELARLDGMLKESPGTPGYRAAALEGIRLLATKGINFKLPTDKAPGGPPIQPKQPVDPHAGQTYVPPTEGAKTPPVTPYLTPEQQLSQAGQEGNWDSELRGMGYQLGDQQVNTDYEKSQIGSKLISDSNSANESDAARGLFHSSIHDADLFDLQATAARRSGFLDSQLDSLKLRMNTRREEIYGPGGEADRYGNIWNREAVDNASAANTGQPEYVPGQEPKPGYWAPTPPPGSGLTPEQMQQWQTNWGKPGAFNGTPPPPPKTTLASSGASRPGVGTSPTPLGPSVGTSHPGVGKPPKPRRAY